MYTNMISLFLTLTILSLNGESTACSTCPPTWTAFGNSCYRIFRTNRSVNWHEAADLCRLHVNCDEMITAQLTKIETYAENNFLSQWLWSAYYAINTYAWIGLREHPVIGRQFSWLDGQKLDRYAYSNWKREENKPSRTPGECVYMAVDTAEGWERDYGNWKDYPCVHKEQWLESYICEVPHCRTTGQLDFFNGAAARRPDDTSCQIVLKCSDRPCLNGATCVDGEPQGYVCQCKDGYMGRHCEKDIDECSSTPCLNGGSCEDGENGYHCACPNMYDGDNCEISLTTRGSHQRQTIRLLTNKVRSTTTTERLPVSLGIGILPKNQPFSVFSVSHYDEALAAIDFIQKAPTFEQAVGRAAAMREHLNEEMWMFVSEKGLESHRDNDGSLALPPIFQILPNSFFRKSTIEKAINDARSPSTPNANDVGANGGKTPKSISNSVDLSDMMMATEAVPLSEEDTEHCASNSAREFTSPHDAESMLSWWREDVRLNYFHYEWHSAFPPTGSGSRPYDRQGELFYYMHQQMLARYDVERIAVGLTPTQPLSDWRSPIAEGYHPGLLARNTSYGFSSRPPGMFISNDIRSKPDIQIPVLTAGMKILEHLTELRRRILGAITSRQMQTENHKMIMTDIETLGSALQANIGSPNKHIYGKLGLHAWGHIILSFITDPLAEYDIPPGVMFDVKTACRDPIFYRWHKFVNELLVYHKETLQPYLKRDLVWNDVEILDVTTNTINDKSNSGPIRNQLMTYPKAMQIDIANDMFMNRGVHIHPLKVTVNTADHVPFYYKIRVVKKTRAPVNAVVRVFLAPTRDQTGRRLDINVQRRLAVEMDKFVVSLKYETETITRYSNESTLLVPQEKTLADQENDIKSGAGTTCPKNSLCNCGWPSNLLLPRGTREGMTFHLFVMLTNWADDMAEDDSDISKGSTLCGLRNRLYPDIRPMGFPLDRAFRINNAPGQNLVTIRDFAQQFGRTNMHASTIKISYAEPSCGAQQHQPSKQQCWQI